MSLWAEWATLWLQFTNGDVMESIVREIALIVNMTEASREMFVFYIMILYFFILQLNFLDIFFLKPIIVNQDVISFYLYNIKSFLLVPYQ